MNALILALAFFLAWPTAGGAVQVDPLGSDPAPEAPPRPPKLQAAIDALNRGDAETALKTAREFVKEDPRSALGHEILGAAATARSQW